MERYREKIWFSIGLNILVLGAMVILMFPFYETDKDIYMCALVNGALGKNESHILFQNSILGKIYSMLYAIFGARFCWYDIFQYALLFAALTSVTFIIIRKWKENGGVLIALIFLLFFGYECCIKMNFIKTAGAASAAGMLLLLYSVFQVKYAGVSAAMGFLLSFAGAMYHFKIFIFCIVLMLPAAITLVLDKRCGVRRVLGIFAALLLIACTVFGVDRKVYQKSADWNRYAGYNKMREELLFLGLPDYQKNRETYTELGINKKSYELYEKGLLYDPDKLGEGTLEKLLEAAKAENAERGAGEFWRIFLTKLVRSMAFCAFVFALLLWGISKKRNVYFWGTEAAEIVFWSAFSVWVFMRGTEQGMQEALCMIGTIVCLVSISEKGIHIDRQAGAVLLAAVLIVSQYTWKENWRVTGSNTHAARVYRQQMLGTIAADRQHLYLAMPGTIDYGKVFGHFEDMPTEIMGNNCALDAWVAASPACVEIMGKYGVNNPFCDIIGNPCVYLIDNDIKRTLAYIRTCYNENAQAVLVEEIGGNRIYQIK